MDEFEERKKKWYLDVRNTPCARSALMTGILGGGAFGILYFAKTKIVRRSCDIAVASFVVLSLTTWEVCRYQKAKQRAEIKRALKILNPAPPKQDGNKEDKVVTV